MQSAILKSSRLIWRQLAGVNQFRRYLVLLFAAALTVSVGVLAINIVVDPLWYWRGNIVTGENFAFNERFAKLNRFLRSHERYDCIIFGSSRVTLFDETQITDYKCANLAFASGVVSEFIATARYIKSQGFSPKLVIVGVDAFNFWRSMEPELTDFVASGKPPPEWIQSYLTASALNFSLRTLTGVSPIGRAYDENFIGQPDHDAPTYLPPAHDELTAKPWKFETSRQNLFFELRKVFPKASFIGYVPPTSAWRTVEELHLTGHMEEYLDAMKSISERFDVLYDFSAPSKLTMLPENTYDGSHYRPAVNASIADVLQGRKNDWGINVSGITAAEYARIYNNAITEFLQSLQTPDSGDNR